MYFDKDEFCNEIGDLFPDVYNFYVETLKDIFSKPNSLLGVIRLIFSPILALFCVVVVGILLALAGLIFVLFFTLHCIKFKSR